MKLTYFLRIIVILLIVASCKKEPENQDIPEAIAQDTTTVIKDSLSKNDAELEKVLTLFIKKQTEIKAALPTLKPQQANALYEQYLLENGKTLTVIDSLEQTVLNNFYSYFSGENGHPKSPPDAVKKKEDWLAKAGLQFWELGEGYVEIITVPDFYLNIFKDYVTPDYKEYLEITAHEDNDLYSADAGLVVSFEEVGNRVLSWENFIAKYPDSALRQKALELYKGYQLDYLFGLDNTPTREYTDKTIYPENIAEFNRFVATYPNSPTTKLVKIMLNHTGTNDELHNIIQKEQKALGLE